MDTGPAEVAAGRVNGAPLLTPGDVIALVRRLGGGARAEAGLSSTADAARLAGLDDLEAASRLERDGANTLPAPSHESHCVAEHWPPCVSRSCSCFLSPWC